MYSVLESDGCLEVCVRLVGRYQSSITVHLCIEGINATGMHHPINLKLGLIMEVIFSVIFFVMFSALPV